MDPSPTCALCELSSGRKPLSRTFDNRELTFCCMGCANVYAILRESGVIASGQSLRETDIFRRSLALGLVSNPEIEGVREKILDPNAPTREILLQVSGMWCSSCAWLIEHALRGLPGVVGAEVFFASDLAKVKYCPQYLPPDNIVARIERLGYNASEYGGERTPAKAEAHDLLLRLGVAGFLWANIMGFSTILYVGYFEQIAASASRILPLLLFALTTPLVFYCAHPILRGAFAGLVNRQVRMETLLALGILSAYVLSASQAALGRSPVYFDTCAAIVTLVLAGKLIERTAKERATRSVSMLYRMMPRKVRVFSPSGERFVAIEALDPGALFVVKAGERIAADGTVVEGTTHADESLLSGEATPVAKRAGDKVISGSLNAGGVITVRAARTSQESTLAQILCLVEHALGSRTPTERAVDRVSRIFVPSVVALAAGVFCVLLGMHYGVAVSLMRATTILVIACPCALGLATPLAITAAVGAAAARGILISDSRVLETLGKLDAVVLDKTGTVTQGKFSLVGVALVPTLRKACVAAGEVDDLYAPPSDHEEFLDSYLPMLASLEVYSEHLLGRSIVHHAREHRVNLREASAVEICKGEGIRGRVSGYAVFLGSQSFAQRLCGKVPEELRSEALGWQDEGRTVAFFGRRDAIEGAIAFGDQLKPGAAEMVQALRVRGAHVCLVSGDARATTAVVARQLGVTEFIAETSPAGKTDFVKDLQRSGLRVAMIGDGVNDAPALAQADLGIAIGTGADIAMNASPIVLASGSLGKVDEAITLAARASRVVKQNLFWAFLYNVLGITLAITGVLTPILAALAMLCSSVSVVGNSMRLAKPVAKEA